MGSHIRCCRRGWQYNRYFEKYFTGTNANELKYKKLLTNLFAQVHNHFNEAVSVYYMTKQGNEVKCVGSVQADENLNLPLDAVYTPTNIYQLFFSVEK